MSFVQFKCSYIAVAYALENESGIPIFDGNRRAGCSIGLQVTCKRFDESPEFSNSRSAAPNAPNVNRGKGRCAKISRFGFLAGICVRRLNRDSAGFWVINR